MNKIAIDIQGLSKKIGVYEILRGKIHRGIILGYLGPNGADTTTTRILLGLLQPTSGLVRVNGQQPTDSRIPVMSKTGVVLENLGLYNQLSAVENLDFFGQIFTSLMFKKKEMMCDLIIIIRKAIIDIINYRNTLVFHLLLLFWE